MEKQLITITIQTEGDLCEMTDAEIKDWYREHVMQMFDPAYGTPVVKVDLARERRFPRLLLCDILGVPPEENFDIEKEFPPDVGDRIFNVLLRFDPRNAEIMRLKYKEGERGIDIANKMGISKAAVSYIVRSELGILGGERIEPYLRGEMEYDELNATTDPIRRMSRKVISQKGLSPEEQDMLREELQKKDIQSVADAHGWSPRSLMRVVYDYDLISREELQAKAPEGLERAFQHWTEDEDAQLLAAYNEGALVSELAKAHKRTPHAIWIRLPIVTGLNGKSIYEEMKQRKLARKNKK